MAEAAPAWLLFEKSLRLCERRKPRGHRKGLPPPWGPTAVGAKGTEKAQRRESRQRQQGGYLWALLLAWQPEGQQRQKDKEEVRTNPGIAVG